MKQTKQYNVFKLKQNMPVNGHWNKPQWQNIPAIEINNYMGEKL